MTKYRGGKLLVSKLNDVLRDCDLKTAESLLALEQDESKGAVRPSAVKRIISRIVKLKAERARDELTS